MKENLNYTTWHDLNNFAPVLQFLVQSQHWFADDDFCTMSITLTFSAIQLSNDIFPVVYSILRKWQIAFCHNENYETKWIDFLNLVMISNQDISEYNDPKQKTVTAL